MQREDYGKPPLVTLPGSSFCPDLISTQGREDPRVKWSAKLLFGSWQFEASMWEDSWERKVWIQKTPAGDALWQNQTWQAEAFTSAVISKQKSQTTYLVCSWDAIVCQRKRRHMVKPQGRTCYEWLRWLRLLCYSYCNKDSSLLPWDGLVKYRLIEDTLRVPTAFRQTVLWDLSTELANGLAIIYIKGVWQKHV